MSPHPLPFPPRCRDGQDCRCWNPEYAPCLQPAPPQEGRGDTVFAVSLSLSVLPGETSGSAGSQPAAEAAAERQERAGIACNQATMRTERGGGERRRYLFKPWLIGLFVSGWGEDTASYRLGTAWEGLGTGLPALGTPPPTFCCLTQHLPASPFRKGGGNKGKN